MGFRTATVRVPIHERVRESLVASFRRQERNQTAFDSTLVWIDTDVGLTGIGEAMLPPERARVLLEKMVGRSPWDFLLDDDIQGILIAVYDLLGQAVELPIARLFASRPKEKIVQTWWSQCYPPEEMAAEARLGAELGYRVHKIKVRPWQDPVAQLAAITDAVPKDFRIWADANSYWGTVEKTQDLCRQLARFPSLFGIESPIPRTDTAGYRRLKGTLPFKLAEHIEALDAMLYVRENLVDAFIVGAPRLGRTMVRHNALAELSGKALWVEHSIQTGIAQVFQAHQAAALPGIELAISITGCLEDDLMVEPFSMEQGYYRVPQKPGLGIRIDDAAVERYRIT